MLPLGADLRIAALSANAGHHDRHAKATPTTHDPQVTVVGAPWNFSIAPGPVIPGPQKHVSERERQGSADERQSSRGALQARAAIGPAQKRMRNLTPELDYI